MTRSEVVIDGETRLVGLMGWPVEHTRSPRMHNAAFRALGMNWVYLPLPVLPGTVGAAVQGLRALGFAGCNVTVPHKPLVAKRVDALSEIAAATGACNTVVCRENGTLYGDNTDGPGFVDDLRAHDLDPDGMRVLVVGAGGAARSVVYSLCTAGAQGCGDQPEHAQGCVPGVQVG